MFYQNIVLSFLVRLSKGNLGNMYIEWIVKVDLKETNTAWFFWYLLKKLTPVSQSKWQRDLVTVHSFFKAISFGHNDSEGGAKLVKAFWGFELDNENFQRFFRKLKGFWKHRPYICIHIHSRLK